MNLKKNSSNKKSLKDTVKKYSFSLKNFLNVRKYCKKIKIDFGITPLLMRRRTYVIQN